MKKIKGFTLIELLIVVAIIAILAAIAVPNFLEAQVRSKVSRAHSDMRSLATAIESYMVDNNGFPVATANAGNLTASTTFAVATGDSNNQTLGSYMNCNYGLASAKAKLGSGAGNRCSFAVRAGDPAAVGNSGIMTLTTPVAYITSYPPDPFADTRGLCFGYTHAGNSGWVLWSYGPDIDENAGGQIGQGVGYDTAVTNTGVPVPQVTALDKPFGTTLAPTTASSWGSNYTYNPNSSNPSMTLLTAGFTYDTTNGSTSAGDVYRTKQ
jgi:prepilin-type N-terminal cleavage/methylation domain-containing protein